MAVELGQLCDVAGAGIITEEVDSGSEGDVEEIYIKINVATGLMYNGSTIQWD
ncbi:MAG: hypothetical protein NVSMB27_19060 [Ktedonobacteraceae bacterium]